MGKGPHIDDGRLSVNGYAKHRGVSRAAVQKAIREGRLAYSVSRDNPRKWARIDPTMAAEEWPMHEVKPPATEVDAEETPEDARTLTDWKTKRERWMAAKAELEAKKLKGELASVEEVKQVWFELAREVRDKILEIPPRLAAQLAAKKSAHDVEHLLADELTIALQSLSPETEAAQARRA